MIFSTAFTRNIILRRIQGDIVTNMKKSSCKVPFIFVRFQLNLNAIDVIVRKIQISNLSNIRPVGAELVHADGRADGRTSMTRLVVAFRNVWNAPENSLRAWHIPG